MQLHVPDMRLKLIKEEMKTWLKLYHLLATVTVFHNQKCIRYQVAIRVQEAPVPDIILRAKFILAPECITKIIQGSNELLPIIACIDRNIETDILTGKRDELLFQSFWLVIVMLQLNYHIVSDYRNLYIIGGSGWLVMTLDFM